MKDPTPASPSADEPAIDTLLAPFRPISRKEVKATARTTPQTETKYIVDRRQLSALLVEMTATFRLREKNGEQVSSYRCCYYDDDFATYYDHQRGTRKRFKARTRHHVDTGEFFFETKLNSGSGQADKIKMRSDPAGASKISKKQMSKLRRQYQKVYGKPFPYDLSPSLHVAYRRITLVSAAGGERVTIEFDIRFETVDGRPVGRGLDLIIVETRSADGKGQADRMLQSLGIRKVRNCSKYCIGSILSGQVSRHNKFRPVMRLVRAQMPSTGP